MTIVNETSFASTGESLATFVGPVSAAVRTEVEPRRKVRISHSLVGQSSLRESTATNALAVGRLVNAYSTEATGLTSAALTPGTLTQ
jgi:hypothetical protein